MRMLVFTHEFSYSGNDKSLLARADTFIFQDQLSKDKVIEQCKRALLERLKDNKDARTISAYFINTEIERFFFCILRVCVRI